MTVTNKTVSFTGSKPVTFGEIKPRTRKNCMEIEKKKKPREGM